MENVTMPTTTPHPFAEFFASLDDLADPVADLRETASIEPVDQTIEKLAEWITEEEGHHGAEPPT